MGYFSNGTEGERFEFNVCEKCVHYDPGTESGECCPVWMAHLMLNYDQFDNEPVGAILGMLMPSPNGGLGNRCAMFIQVNPDKEPAQQAASSRQKYGPVISTDELRQSVQFWDDAEWS